MDIQIYTSINIYVIDNGNIKKLQVNNKSLKSIVNNKLIDEVALSLTQKYIEKPFLKQYYTTSNIKEDKLILEIIYNTLINIEDIKLYSNCKLIDIDYNDINFLKQEITNINTLKQIYNKFTLPELQKVFEKVLNIQIDRRNFRKRLINLNIIEELNEFSCYKGRPAKLYRFKDNTVLEKIF